VSEDRRAGGRTDPPARGRGGRPAVTSTAEVLAAARRLIERDGWQRLTVRRLAQELGIGPTTIYRHVRDREDLLVQLISADAASLPRPELPEDPRDRIVTATVALRDALRALPWAAEVLTVDGFVGRLSDDALWFVEAILDGARRCGADEAAAVALFRNLWYLTVGEILVRARSDGAPPGALDRSRLIADDLDPFRGRDAAKVPRLAEIGPRWPALAAVDTFPAGVRALVDGALGRPD